MALGEGAVCEPLTLWAEFRRGEFSQKQRAVFSSDSQGTLGPKKGPEWVAGNPRGRPATV